MNAPANAAATYRRNAVMTASPEKLIKLLYNAAIRQMEQSRTYLADPSTTHCAEVGESLSKAIGIVGELRTALDHEIGGEISKNLESLYEYCLDELSSANIQRQATPVDNALRVMRTLKEAWDAVIPA